jgi:hypothetical protein
VTRDAGEFSLSIVIVSGVSAAAALRTIETYLARTDIEIVIVGAGVRRRDLINEFKLQDPGRIKIVEIDDRSGIARARRSGHSVATAPIVAFCEDSCTLGPGWAEAWIEAFRADPSALAATGRVGCDYEATSITGRSVFYCEYAIFMNDRPSDDRSARLAGNHFAVRRNAALKIHGEELHETELDRLWPNGRVYLKNTCVYYRNNDSWIKAIRDRLIAGLDFGGLRRVRGIFRVLALGSFAAIWALQAWRVTRSAVAASRDRSIKNRWKEILSFVAVSPIVYLLLLVYSLGECSGRCGLFDRRRFGTRRFGIDRGRGIGFGADDMKQGSDQEREGSAEGVCERDLVEPGEDSFEAAEAGDFSLSRTRRRDLTPLKRRFGERSFPFENSEGSDRAKIDAFEHSYIQGHKLSG